MSQRQYSRNRKDHVGLQRTSALPPQASRRRIIPFMRRAGHVESHYRAGYAAPETWHEVTGRGGTGYRIIVQPPGAGYRHVVTPAEIRQRLALLPPAMLAPLEVVQLSGMTRKRRRYPCYGMQWGAAVYLYPMHESLIEEFDRPPKPVQWNEARMYGGKWIERRPGHWRLIWTEETVKDFYLNNVLIHEVGHLLDQRNTSYVDRERFAEWFAIQYGYKSPHRQRARRPRRTVRRRHHSKR